MRHHQTIGNNIPNNIQADTLVSVRLIVVSDGGAENTDVLEGTVVGVGGRLLDAVDDIKAFRDFAKDGILSVEMGRAADGLIHLDHLWRQFHTALGGRVKFLLDLRDLLILENLSPDDIELTGRRPPFRIHFVALPGHRHDTTTMEDLRQPELCLCGIVEIARTQQLSWFGMLAVGIATLNHKVLDNAMDEQRVIDAHLCDLQEVVACLWRLVIKGDADIACSGLKQYLSALGLGT